MPEVVISPKKPHKQIRQEGDEGAAMKVVPALRPQAAKPRSQRAKRKAAPPAWGFQEVLDPKDYRKKARHWLRLPGINHLPKFRDICREVAKQDEGWFFENLGRIEKVLDAPEVQIFLIEHGAANPFDLVRGISSKNAKLEHAAGKALWELCSTSSGPQLLAALAEQLWWGEAHLPRLESLVADVTLQPDVARNAEELAYLINFVHEGRYDDLNYYLDCRWAYIKGWWKEVLGIRAHRTSTADQRTKYLQAMILRKQGHKWRDVAKAVDPTEYEKDSPHCIERVRRGARQVAKLAIQVRAGNLTAQNPINPPSL
jgi:hypothetical protein